MNIIKVETNDENGNNISYEILTREAKNKKENNRFFIDGYKEGILAFNFGRLIEIRTAEYEGNKHNIQGINNMKNFVKGWMAGANHCEKRKAKGLNPIYLERNWDIN